MITVCAARGFKFQDRDLITRTEVANNGYRDGFSALNNTEESFRTDGPSISVDQRKMNAVRAYFEWMPIR
jgi:phosphodiesterase/alkaline phosphatase D-like protein